MLIGYESSEEEVVRRRQKVTDLMMLGWKLTAWSSLRCLKPSTLKSWRFGGFCNVTFVHPYVEYMLSKGSFVCPSWCTASNPDLTSCLIASGQGSNGFVMRKSWRTCREWITCQGAQRDFCILRSPNDHPNLTSSCDKPTIIEGWLHAAESWRTRMLHCRSSISWSARRAQSYQWQGKNTAMIKCDYHLTMDIFMRKHPISL